MNNGDKTHHIIADCQVSIHIRGTIRHKEGRIMKIAIYGAGDFGAMIIDSLRVKNGNSALSRWRGDEIVAVADIDSRLHGSKIYDYPIVSPKQLQVIDFNVLKITVSIEPYEVYYQLRDLGVPKEKIEFADTRNKNNLRMDTIRKLDDLYHIREQDGNIAECGVFQGLMGLRLNWFFKRKKYPIQPPHRIRKIGMQP